MGAYSFSSASFGNWGALQTALQSDLTVAGSSTTDSSSRSTSSSSLSTLHSASVSVSDDELVLVWAFIQGSNGTADAYSEFKLSLAGSGLDSLGVREPTGSTSGNSWVIPMMGKTQDQSGSITLLLEYRCTSGTCYVSRTKFLYARLKRR